MPPKAANKSDMFDFDHLEQLSADPKLLAAYIDREEARNNKLLEQARRRDPSPDGYEIRQFADLTPEEQAAYEQAPWLAWRHAPQDDVAEAPAKPAKLQPRAKVRAKHPAPGWESGSEFVPEIETSMSASPEKPNHPGLGKRQRETSETEAAIPASTPRENDQKGKLEDEAPETSVVGSENKRRKV